MARCARCGGELEERFRFCPCFCPWCAARQRSKIVEFFSPHPRDAGKALRVSRYLTDDPHIRFSVWDESGVAEHAVSLTQQEAARLAHFPEAVQAAGVSARRSSTGSRKTTSS